MRSLCDTSYDGSIQQRETLLQFLMMTILTRSHLQASPVSCDGGLSRRIECHKAPPTFQRRYVQIIRPFLPHHDAVVVCFPPHASSPTSSTIRGRLRGWVGVHLSLAAGHGDIDEAAGVRDSLLGAALGSLLLLLWLDL